MNQLLRPRATDRLMILTAALLFSTGGAAIKACSFTNWQVATLRSGIAAITLLLLIPAARKGWTWRTWLVGCAYAWTMITFVSANKLTTAANTVFLGGAAPLYILILGPLLLKEPVRRRQFVFMVALAAGIWMIFSGEQSISATAPDPALGNLIGAMSGVGWALTVIGLRWLGRDDHDGGQQSGGAPAVVCGNLLACLAALPAALPIRGSASSDWAAVIFLGVFQIALAYIFLLRGVRRVGALEVSLLVLLEPVLSPLWAWLAHGEQPTTRALLGGLMIIAATAVYTWAEEAHTEPLDQ